MIAAGTYVIAGNMQTQSRYLCKLVEDCTVSDFYSKPHICKVVRILQYPLQVDGLVGQAFAVQKAPHEHETVKLSVYSLAKLDSIENYEAIDFKLSLQFAIQKRIEECKSKAGKLALQIGSLEQQLKETE